MAVTDLPERAVRRFDDAQARHWWLAHPVATVRKYADDRGTALASIITFQMFLGLLPLLVVVLTVLGSVLEGSDRLRDATLESTLAQFPVIGDRLDDGVSGLTVDGPWIVVSVAGLLWTAVGIYSGLQYALNQVWNVEGVDRQGFVNRHVRALALFVLVFGAAIGTAPLRGEYVLGLEPTPVTRGASALVGAALAALLLLGVFRLVVSAAVPVVRLLPAAVLAGLVWELLQNIGAPLVMRQLTTATDLYGGIGFVVVVLLWINLLARSVVFANEWAVVSWDHLWPRRIAQPPLTDADREVLVRLTRNERRRPEQHIDVRFDVDSDDDMNIDVDSDEGRDASSVGRPGRPA